MHLSSAVEKMSALAHDGRLAVFRLLVRAGAEGMAAGEIARQSGALSNTLSAQLAILSHAGLIRSHRSGRSIIYSADYDQMRDLLGFLIADCCAGRPEICEPLSVMASELGGCAP